MDSRDPRLVDFQGLVDHTGIAQRCLDARLQLASRLLGEGDGKNLIDIVHIAAGQSVHDAFIAGHASNSVSVALGMARARTLKQEDYSVLALIGDGALTGGLAYEGLNNAGASGEPNIVILNDNGMSINPNVGAMPDHLSRLRSKPAYYHFKKWYRRLFGKQPEKNNLYRFNHRVKSF